MLAGTIIEMLRERLLPAVIVTVIPYIQVVLSV